MALKVLLVEDDRELRTTLAEALRTEGYEVLTSLGNRYSRAYLGAS